MADLIDREAAETALRPLAERFSAHNTLHGIAVCAGINESTRVIARLPTVPAAPVAHARWVCDKGVSACSGCGGEQHYNDWDELEFTPWCHNCGARMDLEVEA